MTYLEAADWLMRLQGEKVPQAEVDGWLEWSHADPHNLDTFDRMQSLYAELRTVADATRRDFLRLAGGDGAATQRLRRLEQTALWLQRLYEEAGDDGVVEAWLEWCQADPLNQKAFDELAVVWDVSGLIPTRAHPGRQ